MKLDRITSDPTILQGRPCVRGMRISVALVLNLIANGMREEDVLREYPDLETDDIRQCLYYAALLADERLTGALEERHAVSL